MDGILALDDKIHCKNIADLRHHALLLSADGYGVAVVGYHDIYENILTITALPKEETDE